jgi:hypothetical protein
MNSIVSVASLASAAAVLPLPVVAASLDQTPMGGTPDPSLGQGMEEVHRLARHTIAQDCTVENALQYGRDPGRSSRPQAPRSSDGLTPTLPK